MTMLGEIIQKQRREQFAGLRGADIRGRLPVRETLLPPLLKEVVQGSGKLERLQITILDGNRFTVDATVAILFFQRNIRLQLRIDPVVDFAVSPLVKIHILESQGIPGFALQFLLNLLPFPESIEILPGLITINLKTALTRRRLDEFVPLMKRVALSTQPGIALIDFQIGVA